MKKSLVKRDFPALKPSSEEGEEIFPQLFMEGTLMPLLKGYLV